MTRTPSLARRIALRTAIVLAAISVIVLLAEWIVLSSVVSASIGVSPEGAEKAPEVVAAVFRLAGNAITTILVVSAIALLAITLVGTALSHRAASTSLRRVAEIDAHTRRITASTLDERLGLQGPDDEIRRLADTIDATLDRLDDAFAQQERFAANASHELRTPLTVLRSSLEELRVTHADAPEVARSLRSVQRMEEIIEALLLLARTKRVPEQSAFPVDLTAVLRIVHEDVAPRFDQKQITVEFDTETAVPVLGDQTLLVQVVHNLVQNAANHTPTGGRALFRTSVDGDEAVLNLSNEGTRLDAAEAARLVEPFNRGEDSRISGLPGHGLGLSIVSSAVRQHGGSFVLAPRPEGGVIAEARFPLAIDPDSLHTEAEARNLAPASAVVGTPRPHLSEPVDLVSASATTTSGSCPLATGCSPQPGISDAIA